MIMAETTIFSDAVAKTELRLAWWIRALPLIGGARMHRMALGRHVMLILSGAVAP